MLGFGAVGKYPVAAERPLVTDTLTADKGDLTLTGQDAILIVATVMDAEKGDLTLTGQDAVRDVDLAGASGLLTLTGQASALDLDFSADHGDLTLTPIPWGANFEIRPPDGANGSRKKADRKEVRLRKRTIEIEKDGKKKRVYYVDRFAPPPPPPPLELIPDWLGDVPAVAPDPVEPVGFPLLGYADPLALKAEIENAEDERDAIEALSIINQMVGDPAMDTLNAFLAELSQ